MTHFDAICAVFGEGGVEGGRGRFRGVAGLGSIQPAMLIRRGPVVRQIAAHLFPGSVLCLRDAFEQLSIF